MSAFRTYTENIPMLKKNPIRVLIGAAALLSSAATLAAPTFVNGIAIDGHSIDATGAAGANAGRVGFFSDIYYDRQRNQWWGLSDRGPGGGTIPYDTRVQQFTLDIDPVTGAISNFAIVNTVKFSRDGLALNGIAPNPTHLLGNAFDPEGFVVHPQTGHFFVSDEYGPSLYEFNRDGQFIRAFANPGNVIPRNAATGTPNYANDTGNNAGKRTNRGYEGLAISPDGQYLFAMLQSAMLDEGGGNGVYNRIVKFSTATGNAVAQYAYKMEGSSQGRGISALVAINNHQFMVLERNNRGVGVGAEFTPPNKKVYLIDITGASDVSGVNLNAAVSGSFTPVVKNSSVFIDMAANTLPELGNKVPEKWEGLTTGPRLRDGSYLILTGTDNDYSVTQNGSNQQFDVYFRFSDADPYAASIQCPIDQTVGCFSTSDNTPATLTTEYKLLPGVLHGYKATVNDLPGLPVAPSVGVFRNGAWFLDADRNNAWSGCGPDYCFSFGQAGDLPVVGNWTGGGNSFAGVFRTETGEWFLDRNGNRQWDDCGIDSCYTFGARGDQAVAGDWTGTGSAKIGVFRNGEWYLDANGNGAWDGCSIDRCLNFGQAGDLAVVGDWTGDGKAKVGVLRNGSWYLDANGNGIWDSMDIHAFNNTFQVGDWLVFGDWNSDGYPNGGLFRNGDWRFDANGNAAWDNCQQDGGLDLCIRFGQKGDLPVVGRW